jgi:hypothetical protein
MNSEKTPSRLIRLGDIAIVRSGDKGNHANLGVIARDEAAYTVLLRQLTAQRVREYFADWGVTHVERFELANLRAFNFVLYNVLAGGASQSLRIDTQGKLLGTAALEISLPGNG